MSDFAVRTVRDIAEAAVRHLGLPYVDATYEEVRPGVVATDLFKRLSPLVGESAASLRARIRDQALRLIDEPEEPGSPRAQTHPRKTRIPDDVRQAVIDRDGLVCGICRTAVRIVDIHIDHVIAESRGGPTTVENLQVAHRRCNSRKGAR